MDYFMDYDDKCCHQIAIVVFCGKREFKTEYSDKTYHHIPQLSICAQLLFKANWNCRPKPITELRIMITDFIEAVGNLIKLSDKCF